MTFIPDSFIPPSVFETPHLSLEILSAAHAVQDYECVMACADAIRGVFGPSNGWPGKNMSFGENLADLNRHESEFYARAAFAYAIFDKATPRCYTGCLYIKPIKSKVENDRRKVLFDAQAFCWFSSKASSREFAGRAAEEIMHWVKESWPFNAVAFPGRTIGWDEWDSLAAAKTGF